MSKQPDSVRRQLAIGRSISCNDDDDFVECISVSRPPVPVMAEGSSFNSSDSGRMASADRFSHGHAALQGEVSQSVSDINDSGPDGDDNQPGDGSGFPIDSYQAG